MTKPVVFVIGATGSIGTATVTSLAGKYADKVEIWAGVWNPDKADKLKPLAGVRPPWEIINWYRDSSWSKCPLDSHSCYRESDSTCLVASKEGWILEWSSCPPSAFPFSWIVIQCIQRHHFEWGDYLYCPIDPEKTFNAIAAEDAGNASATILVAISTRQ